MEKKLEKLRRLILDMNREDAVILSLSLLENESITIHDLYEKVLKSALYSIDCQELDKECIWKTVKTFGGDDPRGAKVVQAVHDVRSFFHRDHGTHRHPTRLIKVHDGGSLDSGSDLFGLI